MSEQVRPSVRHVVAALSVTIAAAAMAPAADAASFKRCSVAGPIQTLSVKAMTCGEGMNVVPRLFRQHPAAASGPIGATRRYETRGRTRGEIRRLTCSVHYERAGDRILLTMKCRDYRGDGMNYTELQDEE